MKSHPLSYDFHWGGGEDVGFNFLVDLKTLFTDFDNFSDDELDASESNEDDASFLLRLCFAIYFVEVLLLF